MHLDEVLRKKSNQITKHTTKHHEWEWAETDAESHFWQENQQDTKLWKDEQTTRL
jgi:hypothetical protein